MSDDTAMDRLYEVSRIWAARIRPNEMPKLVVRTLHSPGYDGGNPYNGFTGAERRRRSGVVRLLRAKGVIAKPDQCSLCGSRKNVGYHGEDYFDPWSFVSICSGCHGSIHHRFKSTDKWQQRLHDHRDGPYAHEFAALPLVEPDFAGWLRANTPGSHDPVEMLWPGQSVQEWVSRKDQAVDAVRAAIIAAAPSETEWRLLRVLQDNPGSTAGSLTKATGWPGTTAWHLKFGTFCRKLEPALGPAPVTTQRQDKGGAPAKFYIGLLANYDPVTSGFTFKPHVSRALDAL
jgi:hypothetical protein